MGLHRGPCDTWGPPFPKPVWISTCLILPGHLMDPLDGLPSDRGSCRNPCICHQGVKEAWRSWEDRVPLAPAEPDRHPQPLLGRPPVHPALQVRGSLRAVGPASRVTQEASICLGSPSVACGRAPPRRVQGGAVPPARLPALGQAHSPTSHLAPACLAHNLCAWLRQESPESTSRTRHTAGPPPAAS